MAIEEVLTRHGLTQKRAAAEAGVPLATLNDVVNGKRCPTTGTVNRILAFLRKYEPGITYEELFAPDLIGAGRIPVAAA